jgi:hypothetical protein
LTNVGTYCTIVNVDGPPLLLATIALQKPQTEAAAAFDATFEDDDFGGFEAATITSNTN